MSEASLSTGTDAPKRTRIMEELRRRIVQGALVPGEQLPPRTALLRDFAASSVTVQQALDALKREGFVRSEPKQGTFVAENPPHLSRYALVFGPDPDNHLQAFTAALRRVSSAIEKEFRCDFAFFENVTGRADTFEYQGLIHDIRTHRVAGLIFCASLDDLSLSDTPISSAPGIARVAIAGRSKAPAAPGPVCSVIPDNSVFADRSLAWLYERGRRRVAVLARGVSPEKTEAFLLAAQRRGMMIKPCWIHEELTFNQARKLTELLMSSRPEERPDGLILVNEFLIEPVGIGILTAGVQAGSDVDIVAYSNMPCVGSPVVPMRRLGVDMRLRLRLAMDLLDRQQRGESVPPCVLLPHVFEEELARSAGLT